MGLSKNQFEVLRVLALSDEAADAPFIARACGLSAHEVRAQLDDMEAEGWLAEGLLTSVGRAQLNPYRVDNAIIVAAEYNQDFVPFSYEKPECLITVKGEVLIERQIRQLLEAGIPEVIVVAGYKAEMLFYLEDKFGIDVVFNPEFASRGSHSSLMAVRRKLGNSLICSSRDYFAKNPFSRFEYRSFCAALYVEGETPRCCVEIDDQYRIRAADLGGSDSWCLQGHAYFTRSLSLEFAGILKKEYDNHVTTQKRWRQLLLEHVDELDIVARPYEADFVKDFENISQAEEFDPEFIQSGESEILETITEVIGCARSDIRNVYPLDQGLTNVCFHFATNEGEWVYRQPGPGSMKVVDYAAEVEAQEVAKQIGMYTTFLHEDPETGWMLSRFIPNSRRLNPHNEAHLQRAMNIARRLHKQQVTLSRRFDFFEEGKRFSRLLLDQSTIYMPAFARLAQMAKRARDIAAIDEEEFCFCHNDLSEVTLILDEKDDLHLVEWDYAGMADYASDLGTFIVSCQLSEHEALRAMEFYFGRKPTEREVCHCFAYVGLSAWCWYVWSLLKEAEGDYVGDWLFIYHRYAKEYLAKCSWVAEDLGIG